MPAGAGSVFVGQASALPRPAAICHILSHQSQASSKKPEDASTPEAWVDVCALGFLDRFYSSLGLFFSFDRPFFKWPSTVFPPCIEH